MQYSSYKSSSKQIDPEVYHHHILLFYILMRPKTIIISIAVILLPLLSMIAFAETSWKTAEITGLYTGQVLKTDDAITIAEARIGVAPHAWRQSHSAELSPSGGVATTRDLTVGELVYLIRVSETAVDSAPAGSMWEAKLYINRFPKGTLRFGNGTAENQIEQATLYFPLDVTTFNGGIIEFEIRRIA